MKITLTILKAARSSAVVCVTENHSRVRNVALVILETMRYGTYLYVTESHLRIQKIALKAARSGAQIWWGQQVLG